MRGSSKTRLRESASMSCSCSSSPPGATETVDARRRPRSASRSSGPASPTATSASPPATERGRAQPGRRSCGARWSRRGDRGRRGTRGWPRGRPGRRRSRRPRYGPGGDQQLGGRAACRRSRSPSFQTSAIAADRVGVGLEDRRRRARLAAARRSASDSTPGGRARATPRRAPGGSGRARSPSRRRTCRSAGTIVRPSSVSCGGCVTRGEPGIGNRLEVGVEDSRARRPAQQQVGRVDRRAVRPAGALGDRVAHGQRIARRRSPRARTTGRARARRPTRDSRTPCRSATRSARWSPTRLRRRPGVERGERADDRDRHPAAATSVRALDASGQRRREERRRPPGSPPLFASRRLRTPARSSRPGSRRAARACTARAGCRTPRRPSLSPRSCPSA